MRQIRNFRRALAFAFTALASGHAAAANQAFVSNGLFVDARFGASDVDSGPPTTARVPRN